MGALIAAGVITAAGAVTAGAMSMSAADKAAKAQGAAGKKAAKAEREAFAAREKAIKKFGKGQKLLEKDLAAIQAPAMDIAADIREAERITGYNLAQLEQIYPGAASQRQLASLAINDMIQGKLPQAVIGETMREAAQRGGAGFNIATAGKGAIAQAPQYDYARAIGATSLGLMQEGLNQSAKWQQAAGSFIQGVPQISGIRYQYGMGAANIGMQKIDTRRQMLADLYGAQIGGAEAQQQMGQRQYARSQEQIASTLAAREAGAEAVKGGSAALGSAISSGYGAYSVPTGSTALTKEGFYRDEIGAANVMGVAPSQLSYQKPTGGFLGIGGQKGGFYYNPSGPYGRT